MSKYTSDNIESIITLKPYFLVNWHCTGWCNFHCPYCINDKWRGNWIAEDRKIEEAKKINELLNNNNIKYPISFRLIGGEPGFYNWPKILDYIDKIDKVVFVSNFSNSLSYYKNLYIYCKSRKINLFVGLSKHEESVGFDEKIIELTRWCKENKYSEPQVVIVAGNDFDDSYIKYLNENGVRRIRVSLMREESDQTNYVKHEVREQVCKYNQVYQQQRPKYKQFEVTFMDGSKEQFCSASDITNLMDEGGFNPEGFYCSSGPTCIAVLPDSSVVRNKCDFLKDDPLGNILTDNIKIPTDDVLCTMNAKFGTKDRCCTICSGTNFVRKESNNG